MRTGAEILAEIKKVSAARKAAEKKIQRCDDRLRELHNELGKTIKEDE